MKNTFKIILMCSSLFYLGSCTNLDEVLVGELDGQVKASDVEIPVFTFDGGGVGDNDAVSAAFNELRTSGSANHGGYWSIQSVSSDEMAVTQKGSDWYDGGIWIDMQRHTFNQTSGPIKDTWNAQYNAINTCNDVLAEGTLNANQIAQVKVLRAFFYYRLLDLYGRIKLVTTPGVDVAQSTRAEAFAFVESELLSALGIANVSNLSTDLIVSPLEVTMNGYRINQFAALGLLAKLYLNAEVYAGVAKYAEAEIAAGYVIDNGGYTLCDTGCSVPNAGKRPAVASDPETLEGYAAVFAPNNQNNPEIIWAIAFDNLTGKGMNFAQMTLHYTSQFTWNLAAQPWNGYSVLEDFYNSYDAADKRKKANFIIGKQSDYLGGQLIDFSGQEGKLDLEYIPEIDQLAPNSDRDGGARLGKFSFRQGQQPDMDNDMPIIRLGEMYLIRAEAKARVAGDWSLAATDVNTIRARAGLPAMTNITADSFLAERGREMFMEVTRRQDLIRFGKWGSSWWEKTNSDAYRIVFPIPQSQIDASTGIGKLSQNTGY